MATIQHGGVVKCGGGGGGDAGVMWGTGSEVVYTGGLGGI